MMIGWGRVVGQMKSVVGGSSSSCIKGYLKPMPGVAASAVGLGLLNYKFLVANRKIACLGTGNSLENAAVGNKRYTDFVAITRRPSLTAYAKFMLVRNLLLDEFPWLFVAVAASIASAYVQVLIPHEVKTLLGALVVDCEGSGEQMENAVCSLKLLLGYYLTQGVLTYTVIASVGNVAESVAARLRVSLYQSLVYKKMSFYDTVGVIECLERLNGDVYEFKSGLKQGIVGLLRASTQFTSASVSLYAVAPLFAAYGSLGVPLLVLSGSFLASMLRPLTHAAHTANSRASALSTESLLNIRTVKAFATEQHELARYTQCAETVYALSMRVVHAMGLFQATTQLALQATNLAVLAYGATLVVKGALGHADLTCLLLASAESQRAVSLLATLYASALKTGNALDRVDAFDKILEEKNNFYDSNISIDPNSQLRKDGRDASVVFDNITFRYPNRPDSEVISGLSLVAEAGKVTALVGPSGSGKSTLVQLLERFYDCEKGNIYIGTADCHNNIRDMDLRELRSEWVGYIAQEPVLFQGTIRDNIGYGKNDAGMDEIVRAATTANAHEFIMQLPQQYNTPLTERGLSLSGGQKQRIAIARAILKRPKILILDEATSALDPESEHLVQQALDKAQQGRTTIIIAHRLSTVRNAHKIIYMHNGKPLEQGTHDQLIRLKGHYHAMLTSSKTTL